MLPYRAIIPFWRFTCNDKAKSKDKMRGFFASLRMTILVVMRVG